MRLLYVVGKKYNPLVGGPNPSAATRINKRPDGSFFYSVRRGGDGHLDGGPTKKQVLQVQRSETVAIWKGTRTQSVWEYTIPPLLPEFPGVPGFFYLVKIFRFCPNLSVLADCFTYTGHNF